MLETRLVFRNDYRWDLKKVNSVIIPYLFHNEPTLIITIESKSKLTKPYNNAGRLDELLIDYPKKLVASSQVVGLAKNFQISFSQQGRFQLEFFPYNFLGRTQITINKIIGNSVEG